MLPFRDINPTRTFPLVTVALIALNTLVFLYMTSIAQSRGESALNAFIASAALIPREVTGGGGFLGGEREWPTFITAMFLHGGPIHLFGNMLYLWIFGNNVEDIMGHFRYLCFYLLCGILASLAYIFINPGSTIPVLGASGAIAGVLGGYLVRFPSAKVDSCLLLPFFFTIVRLPALIVLAFWFVLQLLSGTASLVSTQQESGGIAYWAHIGGFIAGMLLVSLFVRPQRRDSFI